MCPMMMDRYVMDRIMQMFVLTGIWFHSYQLCRLTSMRPITGYHNRHSKHTVRALSSINPRRHQYTATAILSTLITVKALTCLRSHCT